MKPVTRVLLKLFAFRFYKAHSGLFLFLLVSVLISFFFVNVLNQTHLNAQEKLLHQLGLVLAFVSSPIMMALIFVAWLAYMAKSWSFTRAQFRLPQNHFLYFSINAMSRNQQFRWWLVVEAVIALPLWIYGLFALLIGMLYGHYLHPFIILGYITLLTFAGAAICVKQANGFFDGGAAPWLTRLTHRWPKPVFSLVLYNLLHHQKITVVITKILSAGMLAGGVFLLDTSTDVRAVGIIALGVAIIHAFLILTGYRFTLTYLNFIRNLPYTRARLFTYALSGWLLIMLPELAWLFYYTPATAAIQALLLMTGTTMLFQVILFYIGPVTQKFLTRVFYLFAAFFLAILAGLLPTLAPLSCVVAFILFHATYPTQKSLAGEVVI
jgi:hypothetical protein